MSNNNASTTSGTGTSSGSSGSSSTTASTTGTAPVDTTTTTPSANTTLTDDIKNTFNAIFTSSNIILLLWFLAAYFIAYAVIGTFSSSLTGPEYMLKIVDVLVLIAMFAYLISYYYYNPDSTKNIKTTAYNTLNDTNTLIYTGLFLVAYSLIVFVFHIPTSGTNSPMSYCANGLQHFLPEASRPKQFRG